ncbi:MULTISPECIES: membrane dipeptidase [unclassified Anaeromyxobacter]|uniref:membrane dipeptidase n=1 Tax=unclassified Anaeromyxobacter TaxID=2620896 RepID=UPI001F56AF3B|nr:MULTISPECIES: membrane dipeptidase [unclassified Anaeromyxobacter]
MVDLHLDTPQRLLDRRFDLGEPLRDFGQVNLETPRRGNVGAVFFVLWHAPELPESGAHARALADHRRNLPDDLVRAVAANGGVVGVNFHSAFLDAAHAARVAAAEKAHAPVLEALTRSLENADLVTRMWSPFLHRRTARARSLARRHPQDPGRQLLRVLRDVERVSRELGGSAR